MMRKRRRMKRNKNSKHLMVVLVLMLKRMIMNIILLINPQRNYLFPNKLKSQEIALKDISHKPNQGVTALKLNMMTMGF